MEDDEGNDDSHEDKAVVDYWLKHYVSPRGHCSLCGNSGVVDTRPAKTAAGVPSGRLNYCICPNGQILRAHGADMKQRFRCR